MSRIPNNRLSLPPSSIGTRQFKDLLNSEWGNHKQDSTDNLVRIGNRVSVDGKSSTIAFIGPTEFAQGEWIGVILDGPHGKNDGSYNNVRYFETEFPHGLFCRRDRIQPLQTTQPSQRYSLYDPTTFSLAENTSNNLQIGDRVTIQGMKSGVLKYIGKIHIKDGIWCGIKLDQPLGKHNGKIEGTRYFTCQHRYGIFAPIKNVAKEPLDPKGFHTKRNPTTLSTNSSNQINDSASQVSNLSEFSIASSSQPASFAEILQEKDLLIKQLREKWQTKENENLRLTERIEDLQYQLEQYPTPATQDSFNQLKIVNEKLKNDNRKFENELADMEIRINELQHKERIYQMKNQEQENLISRLKLLEQGKLEKDKNLNDLETKLRVCEDSVIPDLKKKYELLKYDYDNRDQAYHLEMKQREMFHKEKFEKYETTISQLNLRINVIENENKQLQNTNSIKEQRIQDLLAELDDKNETLLKVEEEQVNLQYKLRDIDYEQQIRLYEENLNRTNQETAKIQLELTKLEEEKRLNQSNATITINSLKDDYEKKYDHFKYEIQQLQSQNQTEIMTLNQRIVNYEIEIKDYQTKMNIDKRQLENLQNEIAQLQREKSMDEQHFNVTIQGLEHDIQRMRDELINQENIDGKYRQKIEEYKVKLKHTENELVNLQKEKDDIRYNLNSLQTEHETCLIQLNERDTTLNRNQMNYQISLNELQENKRITENQLNSTIESLRRDIESVKSDKDTNENTLNDLKQEYDKRLAEINQRDMAINQNQLDYEKSLNDLKNEKIMIEEQLNETIRALQTDIEQIRKEKDEIEKQFDSLTEKNTIFNQNQSDFENNLIQLRKEKLEIERKSNETIQTLEQDIERMKIQMTNVEKQNEENEKLLNDLRAEYDKCTAELNERNAAISENQQEYESTLSNLKTDKSMISEQLNEKIRVLQEDLEKIRTEKNENYKAYLDLNDKYEKLLIESNERNSTHNQNQVDYETTLIELKNEKTTNEKQFNEKIQTLENDLETFRNQLINTQNENDKHKKYSAELKEKYEKLENESKERDSALIEKQTNYESSLVELKNEKVKMEVQMNETIQKLKQDIERIQNESADRERANQQQIEVYDSKIIKLLDEKLKVDEELNLLKNHLQNTSETGKQNEILLKERESDYQKQIDQIKHDKNDLESKLKRLEEDKMNSANELNDIIRKLKEEKTIENENNKQEIDGYKTNFEKIKDQLANLNDEKESNENMFSTTIALLKEDFQNKIDKLKSENAELKQNHEIKCNEFVENDKIYQEKQEQLIKEIETLSALNNKLKQDIERLKNSDNSQTIDESNSSEELKTKLDDLQKLNDQLIAEKTSMEERFNADKQTQEKETNEKMNEYQMKIALMKSEYMVEMENIKLDHDQEILRLKTELQQATAKKGKK